MKARKNAIMTNFKKCCEVQRLDAGKRQETVHRMKLFIGNHELMVNENIWNLKSQQ